MGKTFGKILKYGLPLLVSVVLGVYLYHNVDWTAINAALQNDVNYWWFLPMLVINVGSHVFRGLRWQLQLRAIGVNTPAVPVVNSIFATYFINLFVPRLGEVFRVGYISRRENAPFSTVFGTMVSDRLCDTVMVGLLTLLTLALAGDKMLEFFGAEAGGGTVLWWLLGLCAAGAAAAVWLYHSTSDNRVIAALRGIVTGVWQGFMSIARVESLWLFLLYTLLIWGCYFGGFLVAVQAFSFPIEVGVLTALVLFVLSSLGMAVPSNGGLGPWQYAIIFGFALYGLGTLPLSSPFNPLASAFAMLVWGLQTLLLIVLGIYSLIMISIEKRNNGR